MAASITIVDYGLGNLGSVFNMLRYLGVAATITADPEHIAAADKLILGGVGAFDAAVERLRARGLVDALGNAVLRRSVPVLGICLGMQLLTERSAEGSLPGLGWVPGETVAMLGPDSPPGLRVPHMGWNELHVRRPCPLTDGLPPSSRFYFVHSYRVDCRDGADVVATTEYGGQCCAVVQRGHVFGTQFHPEKSHRFGMAVLRNFAALTG